MEPKLPKKMKPMVIVNEKSSEGANICLAITILIFTGFLLYSKYNEEKFQKMLRNSKGFDLQEVLSHNFVIIRICMKFCKLIPLHQSEILENNIIN